MAEQQPDQQPHQPAGSQAGQDQMYCSECGATISRRAEICPNCGVRVQSSSGGMLTGDQWLFVGGFGAIAGLFALALLFAPLTFIAGAKLREYPPTKLSEEYHDYAAYGFMAIGALQFVLWINTVVTLYNQLGIW